MVTHIMTNLSTIEDIIKGINQDDCKSYVDGFRNAAKACNGVLIELNTAWCKGYPSRHSYVDITDFNATMKVKKDCTDQDFVNKAFNKAKGRNIIYVQSDFWGLTSVRISVI